MLIADIGQWVILLLNIKPSLFLTYCRWRGTIQWRQSFVTGRRHLTAAVGPTRSLRPGGREQCDVIGHVGGRRGIPGGGGVIDDVHLGFPSPPVEQVGVGDGRGRAPGHVIVVDQWAVGALWSRHQSAKMNVVFRWRRNHGLGYFASNFKIISNYFTLLTYLLAQWQTNNSKSISFNGSKNGL